MTNTRTISPDITSFAIQALTIALGQHDIVLLQGKEPSIVWLHTSLYSLWYKDSQVTILARVLGNAEGGVITLSDIRINGREYEYDLTYTFEGRDASGFPRLLRPTPAAIVATHIHP